MRNHDPYQRLVNGQRVGGPLPKLFADAGIELLVNRHTRLTLADGQRISLIGLGDYLMPHVAAMSMPLDIGVREPVITLVHNPDAKSLLIGLPWDLLCAGHTHGGQIKIPGYGPLYLPIDDWSCAEGLVGYQGRQVYVSRGIGNLKGIRFNCPPEVSVLELQPT